MSLAFTLLLTVSAVPAKSQRDALGRGMLALVEEYFEHFHRPTGKLRQHNNHNHGR